MENRGLVRIRQRVQASTKDEIPSKSSFILTAYQSRMANTIIGLWFCSGPVSATQVMAYVRFLA